MSPALAYHPAFALWKQIADQTEQPHTWTDLTESERAPYVARAEAELKRIYPERASKLNQRMVTVRAKNLFEQASSVMLSGFAEKSVHSAPESAD